MYSATFLVIVPLQYNGNTQAPCETCKSSSTEKIFYEHISSTNWNRFLQALQLLSITDTLLSTTIRWFHYEHTIHGSTALCMIDLRRSWMFDGPVAVLSHMRTAIYMPGGHQFMKSWTARIEPGPWALVRCKPSSRIAWYVSISRWGSIQRCSLVTNELVTTFSRQLYCAVMCFSTQYRANDCALSLKKV